MTTLVSKNQEKSIDVDLTGYSLSGGDMLLAGTPEKVEEAMTFLMENGLSGVYFDPEDETDEYTNFLEKSALHSGPHGILLYNN